MRRYIPTLSLLFLLPSLALARWEGPWDNKTTDQLSQMDNKGLFNEAFDVCVQRALVAGTPGTGGHDDPLVRAATDYLVVIEGYARDKNDGNLPTWMSDIEFAWGTKECQRVFRDFVGGGDIMIESGGAHPGAAAQTHTAQAKRRAKPKAKPKPAAKPDITEELPPWLAPPKQ